MELVKFLVTTFIVLGCQLSIICCQNCDLTVLSSLSDNISTTQRATSIDRCWLITVPADHSVHIKIAYFSSDRECSYSYLKISIAQTGKEYRFCNSDKINPIVAYSNVTVTQFLQFNGYSSYSSSFSLVYKITNGIPSIEGVAEAREYAVEWLKSQRTSSWAWKEDTPRAVVALYLASAANFKDTLLEEELMAKQTQLKTAVALLKPSLTNSDLSMFVNALLVTCHNPRQFYGNNLVKQLKQQVEESVNFTHPVSYLTLCNANESWPAKAVSDLNNILSSDSEYPFKADFQAMAIIAMSCFANRSKRFNLPNSNNLTLYKDTIKRFKKLQLNDGSFGNVYTTALITQALIASGQERNKYWKLNEAVKYLINEISSSSVDILSIYLTLPILNGKSLMDISKVNCSANPRKPGDDPVAEIRDYLGPKMRVQYSLIIGDEKDVVHTIYLRVPKNYTAAEVMELAKVEDSKYEFKWKKMLGKMYVYTIANVTNDPEAGKFWLLYTGVMNNMESLTHLITSPDEFVLEDGEHLAMWYKTANI